jgi:hypothetical protein
MIAYSEELTGVNVRSVLVWRLSMSQTYLTYKAESQKSVLTKNENRNFSKMTGIIITPLHHYLFDGHTLCTIK